MSYSDPEFQKKVNSLGPKLTWQQWLALTKYMDNKIRKATGRPSRKEAFKQ